MTQLHIRHKLICSIILLVLCFAGNNFAYGVQFGELQYNNTYIDYSKINKATVRKNADNHFEKALKEKDYNVRKELLEKASGEYFILTQLDAKDIYPIIQIARVYDLENQNSYAKAYFFQALKINKYDISANYYFGDFYYYRREYTKALKYYNVAFDKGLRENFDILYKMGVMYEKLGDLIRANQYYKKAYVLKPDEDDVPDRIRSIESLKYQKTGYYYRKRK